MTQLNDEVVAPPLTSSFGSSSRRYTPQALMAVYHQLKAEGRFKNKSNKYAPQLIHVPLLDNCGMNNDHGNVASSEEIDRNEGRGAAIPEGRRSEDRPPDMMTLPQPQRSNLIFAQNAPSRSAPAAPAAPAAVPLWRRKDRPKPEGLSGSFDFDSPPQTMSLNKLERLPERRGPRMSVECHSMGELPRAPFRRADSTNLCDDPAPPLSWASMFPPSDPDGGLKLDAPLTANHQSLFENGRGRPGNRLDQFRLDQIRSDSRIQEQMRLEKLRLLEDTRRQEQIIAQERLRLLEHMRRLQDVPRKETVVSTRPNQADCPKAYWEYKDLEGCIQGPFPSSQMRIWWRKAYFTPKLQLRSEPHLPWVPFEKLFPPCLLTEISAFDWCPLVRGDGTVIQPPVIAKRLAEMERRANESRPSDSRLIDSRLNESRLIDSRLNESRLIESSFMEASRVVDSRVVDSRPSDFLGAESQVNDARFIDARLNDARLNEARLNDARLNDARLNDARLNDARLNDARLNDARLNDARLNDSRLNDARLNDARLNDARLNDSRLNDARLNDARLNDARLNDARLNDSRLKDARLNDARVNDARNNDSVSNDPTVTDPRAAAVSSEPAYTSAEQDEAGWQQAGGSPPSIRSRAAQMTNALKSLLGVGPHLTELFGGTSQELVPPPEVQAPRLAQPGVPSASKPKRGWQVPSQQNVTLPEMHLEGKAKIALPVQSTVTSPNSKSLECFLPSNLLPPTKPPSSATLPKVVSPSQVPDMSKILKEQESMLRVSKSEVDSPQTSLRVEKPAEWKRSPSHSTNNNLQEAELLLESTTTPSKSKAKPKKSGKAVDPALLGFSVRSSRIMQGTIDYGE